MQRLRHLVAERGQFPGGGRVEPERHVQEGGILEDQTCLDDQVIRFVKDSGGIGQRARNGPAGHGTRRTGSGIFPEGHRSKTGEPLRPKSGVALVARLTEAPVLPCSVYWEGKLGFRRKIVIRYGELIPYEAMGLTESSSARELRNATQLLFGKVLESIEVSKNEY